MNYDLGLPSGNGNAVFHIWVKLLIKLDHYTVQTEIHCIVSKHI